MYGHTHTCVSIVKPLTEHLQRARYYTYVIATKRSDFSFSLACQYGNWKPNRLTYFTEVTQPANNRVGFLPMFTDSSARAHPLCSRMSLRTYISLPGSPTGSGLCPPITNSLDPRLSKSKKRESGPGSWLWLHHSVACLWQLPSCAWTPPDDYLHTCLTPCLPWLPSSQ